MGNEITPIIGQKVRFVKMPTYKLIGTKPNETADEAVIRCANNLVKAVLASGRSVCLTEGCSGFDVFYRHTPSTIFVKNILSGWEVRGRAAVNVPFAPPKPPEQDLTQDDAPTEAGESQ